MALTGAIVREPEAAALSAEAGAPEGGRAASSGLGRHVARSAVLVGLGNYLQLVVSFGTSIVLSRILTPEYFGLFGAATTLQAFATTATQFGFEATLLTNGDGGKRWLGTHFALRTGMALTSVLIGLVFFALVSRSYTPIVARLLIALLVFGVLNSGTLTPRTALERRLDFRTLALADFAGCVVASAVSIGMALRGFGVMSLLAGSVVPIVTQAALIWAAYRGGPPLAYDPALARQFWGSGKTLWLAGMSTVAVMQFDNLTVATFCSSASLGYYVRAYGWAVLPAILTSGVLAKISRPLYARLQSEPALLSSTFNQFMGMAARVSALLSVSLFAVAPELVTRLLGEKWRPAVAILRMLLVYSILRPVWEDQGSFLTMTGRLPATLKLVALPAFAMLLLAPWLALRFGPLGVGFAASTVLVVGIATGLSEIRRATRVEWAGHLLRPLASAAAAAGVVLLLERALPGGLLYAPVKLAAAWLVLGVSYLTWDRACVDLLRRGFKMLLGRG